MSEFQALYARFVDRYRHDICAYAKDIHGLEFDRLQRPIVLALQNGAKYVTVRSGHGVGKTKLLSVVVSHFCNTRYPWRVPMTAPTAKQLWDGLWPEVRARFAELPGYLGQNFDVMAERITLKQDPDNCFVSPRTTSKDHPEALQGIHSENVLIIGDEASGIPDEVFVSGQGSMSGPNAQTLLAGNPTKRSGFFFRTQTDPALAELWTRFRINGEESAWVSADFVKSIVIMFGRDSNEYRVRVLGEFPETDDQSFIPRSLVLAAQQRDIAKPPFRPIWGIDPARFGRDKTSFCERIGSWTAPFETWHGMDTMHTCGFVIDRFRKCFPGEEPSEILVDVIGIGAGVVDRLTELGLPVRGLNVSETPPMRSQGVKLRDELWIRGREELYARRCRLPPDDPDIADQLSQPLYEFQSDGRIRIEGKEAMKKRLGVGCPDKADSWLLTYGGDAAAVLGQALPWAKSMARRLHVT